VIDATTDPNLIVPAARTPTVAPTPTPAPTPTVEVAGAQTTSVVDDVLLTSLEPALNGGRIGLLGGALSGLAALGIHLFRRRRPRG
jgi:hypothetical protein